MRKRLVKLTKINAGISVCIIILQFICASVIPGRSIKSHVLWQSEKKKCNRLVPCDKEIKVFVHLCLLPQLLSMENYFLATGQCKTQTVDYCLPHANENVTTIVPLFYPKNNGPQSVCILHCLFEQLLFSAWNVLLVP